MEFYAVLTVSTVLIAVLAVWVFRKTRDVGTLVGTAALYHWSLYGAWYLVIDKTGGFSGKHYQYLETKLFPISLDNDYLTALCLYASFIILVQITLLMAVPTPTERPLPRIVLRHEPILAVGFGAGILSLLLIIDQLGAAAALGRSAYNYTRSHPEDWFTLHQVLNRVAMLPAAIGFATLAAGKRSRFFVSVRRRYTAWAYVLLLGGMGVFTFLLGNKNEVLVTLVAGVLAYLASVRRPNYAKVALTLVAGAWFLYAIDFFRATPINELPVALTQNLEDATEVGRFLTSSNEAYGAHFSMYGVLSHEVPLRMGYSIYALACSVIPRLLWSSRPPDIYLYYSESVGAIQNQGYSLHHATGWYLNFGYAGVALGALVMGLVWSYCMTAWRRIRPKSGLAYRLFATLAPWLFAAYLPALVRAGPEGYKGFVVEGILIPTGLLLFCCRPRHPKRGKTRLVFQPGVGWALERS